jgi:protein-S-isoprenylcysteine O-methyltransferase Ste14
MIETALVTLLPAGFLVVLLYGGALFQRRNIEQDGEAPINRTLFYSSKYSILVLWGAMVIQS